MIGDGLLPNNSSTTRWEFV